MAKKIDDSLRFIPASEAKEMVGAKKTSTLLGYCSKHGIRVLMPSPRKIVVNLGDLKQFQKSVTI